MSQRGNKSNQRAKLSKFPRRFRSITWLSCFCLFRLRYFIYLFLFFFSVSKLLIPFRVLVIQHNTLHQSDSSSARCLRVRPLRNAKGTPSSTRRNARGMAPLSLAMPMELWDRGGWSDGRRTHHCVPAKWAGPNPFVCDIVVPQAVYGAYWYIADAWLQRLPLRLVGSVWFGLPEASLMRSRVLRAGVTDHPGLRAWCQACVCVCVCMCGGRAGHSLED